MRGGTGDGGRVENGDAKNAFVLEWGGEEDAVDVDEARSENVDDSEDVDELDERMRGGTPSCAMPCQWREEIKSTPSSPDLPMSQNIHVTRPLHVAIGSRNDSAHSPICAILILDRWAPIRIDVLIRAC